MAAINILELKDKGLLILDSFLQDKEKWNLKFDHFCRFSSVISGKPIAFNSALAII